MPLTVAGVALAFTVMGASQPSLVLVAAFPASAVMPRVPARHCRAGRQVLQMDGNMFNMPNRNESKIGEATETLRRDYKQQVADSKALPGFLRGAVDPLRLKRNVKESRLAYLSRMLQGIRANGCSRSRRLLSSLAGVLKPCLPDLNL